MFERFTDRARRVVVFAQEEAKRLNHNYIGTEHILLGLLREGEGIAAKALEALGIALEHVRLEVERIIGQGETTPTGHIPFTPRAKKVLELSLREALQLGHNYIGTEHVLLGLLREGEGVAAQVLVKSGAPLETARQEVMGFLSGHTGERVASAQFAEAARLRRPPAPDLSPRGRLVLELGRQIAARSGRQLIEPDDMLLGLLGSEDPAVARTLEELGVSLADLLRRVDELAGLEPGGREGRGTAEAGGPEGEGPAETGGPKSEGLEEPGGPEGEGPEEAGPGRAAPETGG